MLPTPIEWQHLEEHWDTIRCHLSHLNLENYRPNRPIAVTAAKDERNTRILHLLHPEDLLLYTSLTLLIKADIEASRVPKTAQRVYSYRASSVAGELYGTTQKLHDSYVARLAEKVGRPKTHFVGVTDVANFYSSLSQKALRRLLLNAAKTKRAKRAARLLVSNFAGHIMPHRGKGIPTGPFASRILAEVLLNDIDRYLRAVGVDFVRWVDDYNFFSTSFERAQRSILELSGWLYREHDLSLQPAKTHIVDADTFSTRFLASLGDRSKLAVFCCEIGYDASDDELDYLMEDWEAIELLEMLVDAIWDEDVVDYRLVRLAASRLRRLHLDSEIADDLLDILTENLNRLWAAAEDVGKLVAALLPRVPDTRKYTRRLLKAIGRARTVDHQAVWILTAFAEDRECWGCADEIAAIISDAMSEATKHYAALAMGHSSSRTSPPPLGEFLRQGCWPGWR